MKEERILLTLPENKNHLLQPLSDLSILTIIMPIYKSYYIVEDALIPTGAKE